MGHQVQNQIQNEDIQATRHSDKSTHPIHTIESGWSKQMYCLFYLNLQ
uniref:Uncharacterized protein n=1 Tax=Anguilla anguilla TaxID=7936 RepID=A0A0E9PN93_ANGAN